MRSWEIQAELGASKKDYNNGARAVKQDPTALETPCMVTSWQKGHCSGGDMVQEVVELMYAVASKDRRLILQLEHGLSIYTMSFWLFWYCWHHQQQVQPPHPIKSKNGTAEPRGHAMYPSPCPRGPEPIVRALGAQKGKFGPLGAQTPPSLRPSSFHVKSRNKI